MPVGTTVVVFCTPLVLSRYTVRIQSKNGGTAGTAVAGSSMVAGQWHLVAGVFTATNDRTVYLDKTSGVQNTTTVVPTGIDQMVVGARQSGGFNDLLDDAVGMLGVWDVALTANEIAALAAKVHPSRVRPLALTSFYLGDASGDLIDLSGNKNNLVETNGPITVVNNPPVVPYSQRFWGHGPLIEVAAGGGFFSRRYYDQYLGVG